MDVEVLHGTGIASVKRHSTENHFVQVTPSRTGTVFHLSQRTANFSDLPTLFNPHLPSGPVYPYQLDESICKIRDVLCSFSFLFYFEYILLLANSEDPDQTPRSAASDLGQHCLPMAKNGTLGLYGLRLIVPLVSFGSPWPNK